MTSTNAFAYAYQTSGNDETRRLLLLQNASFLPLFRQAMTRRGGKLADLSLDKLEPLAPSASGAEAVGEIFADVGKDRHSAARKMLAYLNGHPDPADLMTAARTLIFLKGNNAHDYKFSSAVLEDHFHVSPAWRNRYLASSVYNLRGSQGPDNQLVARTRAALRA